MAQRHRRSDASSVAVVVFLIAAAQSLAQSPPLFDAPAAPPANITPPTANVVAPPAIEQPSLADEQPHGEMVIDAPRPRAMEDSKVVARVNGEVILACEVMWMANMELEQRLGSLPAEQREQISATQLDQARESLTKNMFLPAAIDRKIKYTDFLRNAPQADLRQIHANLDVPFEEKELPRLLKVFKAATIQELETKLHAVGTSLAEQREMFYEQMISHSWIREQLNVDETVTHEDMLAYYREHATEYEFPTQARWEELMVRFDRSPGANWEERKANAYRQLAELGNHLWQRVQAMPPAEQAFVEVAKTYSHGVTASEGGLYDWTTQGALRATAIDAAIFSLPPGQMSDDILASDDGWHIVRVLERKEAGRTPFTEVQAEITKKIVDQRFEAAAREKIEKLRADARIWTIHTGPTTAEALFKRPDAPTRR